MIHQVLKLHGYICVVVGARNPEHGIKHNCKQNGISCK